MVGRTGAAAHSWKPGISKLPLDGTMSFLMVLPSPHMTPREASFAACGGELHIALLVFR